MFRSGIATEITEYTERFPASRIQYRPSPSAQANIWCGWGHVADWLLLPQPQRLTEER